MKKKANILVVDDEAIVRESLRDWLSDAGHRVLTAEDGIQALDIIEKEMISYFQPDKINIAQFGNYLPHLHWHIMARFEKDAYFPEPMWGTKQRESNLNIPPMDEFVNTLLSKIG